MRKSVFRFVLLVTILILTGTAAAQEEGYRDLGMVLMLPSLDIEAEVVLSPWNGDNWDVYWLDNRVGMLEGSAMPGKGYSVLAGHNHLSAERTGPFLMIHQMQVNDVIFIADDSGMMRFRVYANELLDSNDGARLSEVAHSEPGTLVLLTCENETPEGTYANRRAIFAKPIG